MQKYLHPKDKDSLQASQQNDLSPIAVITVNFEGELQIAHFPSVSQESDSKESHSQQSSHEPQHPSISFPIKSPSQSLHSAIS